MFTRVVTYTNATDIDAGLRYVQDTVVPLLHGQNGFRGINVSVDRSGGVLGVLGLWATEADRDASESPLGKARQEGQRIIGGDLSVEHFEELLVDVDRPPTVGSALHLRRISMDPATVDENLEYFRQEVVPVFKAAPGFCAVRNMMNRQTGEGIVGTVWVDKAARDAAAEAGDARRQLAAQRGVTFGEQSKRELVLVDLP
jgi:hypothetical protein